MDKTRSKKMKAQQEPKLTFGSALKKNVKIILNNNLFFLYVVQQCKCE